MPVWENATSANVAPTTTAPSARARRIPMRNTNAAVPSSAADIRYPGTTAASRPKPSGARTNQITSGTSPHAYFRLSAEPPR